MAKKQTRRSISVSRNTYERLKSYCETNGISMSQFVERRVGDFLGSTTGLSVSSMTGLPRVVSSAPAPGAQSTSSADDDRSSSTDSQRVADQIFTF